MIAFIEGTIVKKGLQTVIIGTASGLGYEVYVPVTDLAVLPGAGKMVRLHTYLQIKEEGVALFGFLTEEALQVFKLLITVSGIGPKGALGILSGISLADLRFAVLAEDVKTISKIPGIGAKTAGKLILELKDKFRTEDFMAAKQIPVEETQEGAPKNMAAMLREEAAQALTTLGISMTDAMKALKNIEITETTTVEDLLKQGLKKI